MYKKVNFSHFECGHYQEAKQNFHDKQNFVRSAWLLQHVEYDADPLYIDRLPNKITGNKVKVGGSGMTVEF